MEIDLRPVLVVCDHFGSTFPPEPTLLTLYEMIGFIHGLHSAGAITDLCFTDCICRLQKYSQEVFDDF